MTGPDVAVIGGGLAGIAAALTLADGGARVALYEQRPHLGGAASSFRRGDLCLDYGQHVFLRCCTAYRSLIRRIGGEPSLHLQDRLEAPVFERGPRPSWIRRGVLPPPLHLARAIAAYHPLSPAERLAVVPAARALKHLDPRDESLDQVTFGSWLKERGQSRRAIETFWDLIALPTLNLPSAQASLLVAARTFQIGVLTDAAAADIGWATVPLSYLHDQLASEALSAAGVDVRTRARVAAVRSAAGRNPRLSLEGGPSLEVDAAILAVPPRAAWSLASTGTAVSSFTLSLDTAAVPAFLDIAGPSPSSTGDACDASPAALESSPIVNIHLRFDRQVMPYPLAAALGPIPKWIFDRTGAAKIASGQYLVVSESAADHHVNAPKESVLSAVLRSLGELFPKLGKATLVDSLVIRDREATIRVGPGSDRLRAGGTGRFPRVFPAGAWTDTGWPPTMESAVRSGQAAAEAVLYSTGCEEGR